MMVKTTNIVDHGKDPFGEIHRSQRKHYHHTKQQLFYQMKNFDHLQEKFYLSLQSQRVGVDLNDKQYRMEKNPKHWP